ncbi:MAG: DUF1640 domain-containing protein [Gammaproteobacteria bacterium]|nr:DUF1640 domain-containing protein [Gammaproteobacteria bacterium]
MTEAIAFDTHRFVKRLTRSGFTEEQAETLADEHVALLNANLATKGDIAAVEADLAKVEANLRSEIAKVEANLRSEIAKVEANLRSEIAKVEANLMAEIAKVDGKIEASRAQLLKWMIGALIAQGGLIVALVKLL